jgi:hypothetical protein
MTTSVGKKVIVSWHERRASELVKRIGKLRWMGLEHEAEKLQRALPFFPTSQRAILLGFPDDTD